MVPTRTERIRALGPSLELFAVIMRDAGPGPRRSGIEAVSVRDLAAIVRHVPFARVAAEAPHIAEYRAIIEDAFTTRAVLPAPFGTVFRHREALARWLELHYHTLVDALRYLQDRQVTRVFVTEGLATSAWDTAQRHLRDGDLEVTAFDSFRVLKKEAVAFVPIDGSASSGDAAEGAFLVERDRWDAFCGLLKEEQRRLPHLRFEQTGPWPPYDFVRLELNG